MNQTPSPVSHHSRQGLLLGLLGIVIFSLTLSMTRLAVGTPEAPQMSSTFIAMGRAVVAAVLSAGYLWWCRAPRPQRADLRPLAIVAGGVIFGFPLLTSMAMRHVESVHANVILGVLPLATAAVGARLHRQRPSAGFWLCAVGGSALVVCYALLRSGHTSGTLRMQWADLLLLAACLCAAVGYGFGARLSQRMPPEHVICWALLLSLPISLPVAAASLPTVAMPARAWWAMAYVSVFSMWLGFIAWYRGLALGGTVRVSQVQLLQPFLGMLFAVPLLGERLDAQTLGFGLAVIAVVFLSKKMPVASAPKPS